MSGHSEFQSAAKRHSMNRHHHRLDAVFDVKQQGEQSAAGLFSRRHLAEFLDVCPGDKSAAAADNDRCLDGRVAVHLIDRRPKSLWYARTESVHRRVVNRHDRDIVFYPDSHEVIHRQLSQNFLNFPGSGVD